MLGSLVIFLKGIRRMMFQLSGFYYKGFLIPGKSLHAFFVGQKAELKQLVPAGCRIEVPAENK